MKASKICETEPKISDLLHDLSIASGKCNKNIKNVIDIAKKAAEKGKTEIKIECSQLDHDCVQFPLTSKEETSFVRDLKSHGFKLIGGFGSGGLFSSELKYYLKVFW